MASCMEKTAAWAVEIPGVQDTISRLPVLDKKYRKVGRIICLEPSPFFFPDTDGELPNISYPLPLPLLGQKDDDQLGMHLVSVLTERQIPAFKGDIDQVPVRERREKGEH